MEPGTRLTIRAVGGTKPIDTLPSGAPIGALIGEVCTVVGPSQSYNSSVVVDVAGRVYDIHDQYLI